MGTNWEFWAYDFFILFFIILATMVTRPRTGCFVLGVDDALDLSALHVYCIRDNCAVLCCTTMKGPASSSVSRVISAPFPSCLGIGSRQRIYSNSDRRRTRGIGKLHFPKCPASSSVTFDRVGRLPRFQGCHSPRRREFASCFTVPGCWSGARPGRVLAAASIGGSDRPCSLCHAGHEILPCCACDTPGMHDAPGRRW
jgi:hypothetical protein